MEGDKEGWGERRGMGGGSEREHSFVCIDGPTSLENQVEGFLLVRGRDCALDIGGNHGILVLGVNETVWVV
jgi:hypothetical protein